MTEETTTETVKPVLRFTFTIDETNLVLYALSKLPYENVVQIVENIKNQAQAQLPLPTSEENLNNSENNA